MRKTYKLEAISLKKGELTGTLKLKSKFNTDLDENSILLEINTYTIIKNQSISILTKDIYGIKYYVKRKWKTSKTNKNLRPDISHSQQNNIYGFNFQVGKYLPMLYKFNNESNRNSVKINKSVNINTGFLFEKALDKKNQIETGLAINFIQSNEDINKCSVEHGWCSSYSHVTSVKKIIYASIPLLFSNSQKRYKLFYGFRFNYLLKAIQSSKGTTGGQGYNGGPWIGPDINITNQIINARNIDIGLVLGFNFIFSENFSYRIDYNHSFVDNNTVVSIPQKNILLTFGIKYSFIKSK